MASRFWVGGTGAWDASDTTHWASSSGGAGGQTVPGASDTVTFDGSSGGGTVTVNTNFSVVSVTMGAFTGTLDFATNNNSPTMGSFSTTGSGTRTLNMGSGIWTLTGNAATILNMDITTNFTLNSGTCVINATYSGSTGTRTFSFPGVAKPLYDFKVSAGSDTVTTTAHTVQFNDVNFTGFTGTWTPASMTVMGNFTLGTGMSVTTNSNATTFSATSAKNITMNGVQYNIPMTFNGVNGSWTLKSDLNLAGATARAITLTNGTIDAADSGSNHNVTCGSVSASNSNTRSIVMGNGTWELQGTGTVWTTATTTGLTITPGTSTIKITDSSNTNNTFAGGSTFGNIWWARGASTATNTLTGTSTFIDFKDTGSAAHTITFPNVTTTVTTFTVSGSVGNLITLARTGGSGTFTLSKSSGTVVRDYLSISNSTATGGASWYAGANSTDGGGNSGWIFSVPQPIISTGGGTSSISNLAALRIG